MIKRFSRLAPQAVTILGSSIFFRCIVGLLVVEAAWIALSGRYPMAFDEDFHLGVIRLYAHHLNPFWSAHPDGGDAFGAVARDPSYLYQYLLSFVYRFLSLFTDNQTLQVLVLRGINIALFASGLPLYRRLLAKTGASSALVNTCLLIFILIPIVPLLAAQINYDNLIMPLTALSLLLAVRLEASLKAKRFPVVTALQLVLVMVLSSLVKYAYLPVAIGIVGYLLVRIYKVYHRPGTLWKAVVASWRPVAHKSKVLLLIGIVVVSGLFIERYGINLVRYHTPVPDCAQALDYDHCQYYGPWIRDYNFEHTKAVDADRSPIDYTQHWLYGMWFRSFFAVDGPATLFQTRGPLTLPAIGSLAAIALGVVAFILNARRLWRRHHAGVLWLLASSAVVYVTVLWLTEYQLFVQTGQPVAINGRYLLPILPGVMVMTALAIKELLGNREGLKVAVAGGLVICMLWGGGTLTYILRSNDGWYWPHDPLNRVNYDIQHTLGPITPGYKTPTQFLH